MLGALQETSRPLVYTFGFFWKPRASPSHMAFTAPQRDPAAFFRWRYLHSRHSSLKNARGPPSWLLAWTTFQDGAPQSAASGPARDPRFHGNHSNGRDPSCVILASEICPSGRLAGCHKKSLNNKLTVGVLTQSRLHRAGRAHLSHCKMGPSGIQVNREVQVWPTAC